MKDVTGKEIQVGDTIAFARRLGRYNKNHKIVKGTVTEVRENRITYSYESQWYNYQTHKYESGTRKTWTKSPQKTLVI